MPKLFNYCKHYNFIYFLGDEMTDELDYGRFEDVLVDFRYVSNYETERLQRYRVFPKILYRNEHLDTVILQLKPSEFGTPFPAAISNIEYFNVAQHEACSIFLVGHSHSGVKEMDKIIKYWDPLPHRVKELEKWSQKTYGSSYDMQGHIGLENRIMFDCSFRQGASGSPGFHVYPNGQVVLLTMLLRGYPDFYYMDNFEKERDKIDSRYLKQQGVNIGAVARDMKVRDKTLYKEIFERNLPIEILTSGSSTTLRMISETETSSETNLPVVSSLSDLKTLQEGSEENFTAGDGSGEPRLGQVIETYDSGDASLTLTLGSSVSGDSGTMENGENGTRNLVRQESTSKRW